MSRLSSGYGGGSAIRELSLHVDSGEVVALVGPNGAGKTTLLRTLAGLLPPRAGEIRFAGNSIGGLPAHHVVRAGLVLVPEARQVFDRLTTEENLRLGGYSVTDRALLRSLYRRAISLFPVLGERASQRAGTLSGGEQQMLALARSLMARPRMLLLDEPSMGLGPSLVESILQLIRRLSAEEGLTVLISEQSAYQALAVADRAYVLESGSLVASGTPEELTRDGDIRRRYLAEAFEPGEPGGAHLGGVPGAPGVPEGRARPGD